MLLYSYDIVFQEVPGETTLALNISQCPHRCPGCHSEHLWGNKGEPLTMPLLHQLLRQYIDDITCLCFMGGDGDLEQLKDLVLNVRQVYPNLSLAWYTGYDFDAGVVPRIWVYFDYVKFGSYVASKGGLGSPATNQRMLKRDRDLNQWIDITYLFQKNHG